MINVSLFSLADATGLELLVDKARTPWSIRGGTLRSLRMPAGIVSFKVPVEIVSSHVIDDVVHAIARGPGHLSFFFQADNSEVDVIIFDNDIARLHRSGALEREAKQDDYDPHKLFDKAIKASFKAKVPLSSVVHAKIEWSAQEVA